MEKVVHAFVSSRLDYCNVLYLDLNQLSLSHLQLVQNSAARLLTGTKGREHTGAGHIIRISSKS